MSIQTYLKHGDLTGSVIGLAVAAVVAIGAGIPIVTQVITSSNLTGITATVVGFIPVMIAIALLVASVGVMRGGQNFHLYLFYFFS